VEETLGVYIAVPFCRAKCSYCNFASGVQRPGQHARYVQRVCEDLRRGGDNKTGLWPQRVASIYLGGGTPSLLAPELLDQIFLCLRDGFAIAPEAEITVECAPGQIPDGFLDAMLRCGVNRVSLGVQSFVDAEARAVGRSHTGKSALAEIARLRSAGIGRVSADLIAGLPGQTFASWRRSLEMLVASGVDHASVYMLEVDEDSRLGRELIGGGSRYGAALVPGEDAVAEMYEGACSVLAEHRLGQYEISNFAREGCESTHNRRYWERGPYLGVGLDAHSMLRTHDGRAVRWGQTDDLAEYLRGNAAGEPHLLSRAEEMEEAWFLGLRLNQGVSWAALEGEFGGDVKTAYEGVVRQLRENGLLEEAHGWVRLTGRGRMVSNEVFAEFLLGDCEAMAG
jgi:oxygen-independent coproporphyrinogen-3 oxidase